VLVADYRRALGVVDVLIPVDLSNGGIVYDCVASVVKHIGLVKGMAHWPDQPFDYSRHHHQHWPSITPGTSASRAVWNPSTGT